MTDPEPNAGSSVSRSMMFTDATAIADTEKTREQVVVRRRRSSRHRPRRWAARMSLRRSLRAAAVSAGVLLLMAVGLYLGLARQEASPGGGSRLGAGVANRIS